MPIGSDICGTMDLLITGTVATSIIPLSNHYVGAMIQDDSAVAGGGEGPPDLDDWIAYSMAA